MGSSHSYWCAHCRCYNFWGQVVQVSGNTISSSQHHQDFGNIPASQEKKNKKENFPSIKFFLVGGDRLGVDTQNSSCAGDYSSDQGWVELRCRFSKSTGEAMVLTAGPLPLSTILCWAFWALHIFTCTVPLTEDFLLEMFLLEISPSSQETASEPGIFFWRDSVFQN